MKITEHFYKEEFESSWDVRNGRPMDAKYPIDWIHTRLIPLCECLEIIRKECGNRPIRITSGYRSMRNNYRVGSSEGSQHRKGRAVDFYIPGMNISQIHKIISKLIDQNKIKEGGLGVYVRRGFVHYDTRGYKARWSGK